MVRFGYIQSKGYIQISMLIGILLTREGFEVAIVLFLTVSDFIFQMLMDFLPRKVPEVVGIEPNTGAVTYTQPYQSDVSVSSEVVKSVLQTTSVGLCSSVQDLSYDITFHGYFLHITVKQAFHGYIQEGHQKQNPAFHIIEKSDSELIVRTKEVTNQLKLPIQFTFQLSLLFPYAKN